MNVNFRNKKTTGFLKLAQKKLPPIQNNEQNTNIPQNEQSIQGSRISSRQQYLDFNGPKHNLTYQFFINNMLQRMDPRDQRVIIPYLSKTHDFILKDNIRQFDKWLGEMHFAISSSAFRLFMSKQVSYEEVKVYFSQNLLLNLLLFLQQVGDMEAYQIMKYLNKRLIDNLFYMVSKYPISKQIKPNKRLREAFSSVNNMANDENDMLIGSSIKFEQKQKGDYLPEIMKVINYLIQITSQKCRYLGKQTTYFNAFTEVMQKIFQSVETPEQALSQAELFKLITGYESGSEIPELRLNKQVSNQGVGSQKLLKIEEKIKQNQITQQYPNVLALLLGGNEQNKQQIVKGTQQVLKGPEQGAQIENELKNLQKLVEENQSPSKNPQNKKKQDNKKTQHKKKVISQRQLKQFKQKIKKYTNFKINQKINPNTELYSENEIATGNFSVKSTAILRLLTKWTSQLQNKIFYAAQEIKNRSFRFKTNQNTFIKLNSSEKNDLYLNSQKKKPMLDSYFEDMLNQCIQIEGSLAKSTETDPEMANIPRHEYQVGKFCSRLQSAASTYIVSYLNKIIQALLEIPNINESDNKQQQSSSKIKSINFITFKVADLMRCKCHSRQNEILRIFSIIKKISEQNPDLFKIVRIKDRLQLGTRDILINVNFMNRILCQIQLAIAEQIQEKQKMYDSFNHYLYELRRSDLGPIMQSACIWTHLDQRSKNFKKMTTHFSSDSKVLNVRKHICQKKEMISYGFAFICSLCGNYYSYPTGLIGNKKCSSCKKYYQCNSCLEQKMSSRDLKQFLGLLSNQLIHFDQQFEEWTSQKNYLPDFAIFIPKKNKQIIYMFGQKITVRQKIYYIRTVEKQVSNGNKMNQNQKTFVVQPRTIIILKGDSKKDLAYLEQNYFVFQWLQKRHINKTHLSSIQKQRQYQQIKLRIQEEQQRKKQKQKIKQEIKARRQADSKKWKGLLAVEQNSSEQEEEEGTHKHKQDQNKQKEKAVTEKMIEGVIQKDAKQTVQNVNKLLLKFLIPSSKNAGSRPGTAVSKTSKGSKGSRTSSKMKQDLQNQVNIQIFAKVSRYNSYRVCEKKVGHIQYNLILNYYLSESKIKSQIKQQFSKIYLNELLLNKNEVLFLEQSKISNRIIQQPTQNVLMSKSLASVTQMYLDQNLIENLGFIKNFVKLRVFHANHNNIGSMAPLGELKNLAEIMLINNNIYDISGLENKSKLVTLNLTKNCLSNIQNLDSLPRLTNLFLSNNSIGTIQGLNNLKMLIQCDLSVNNIKAIAGLNELTQLEKLNLGANYIKKIQNLETLTLLKYLDLSRNQIQRIENLQNLQSLTFLSLEKNNLFKIQNLGKLVKLKQLHLSKNSISKLENLSQLVSLKELNISHNKISILQMETLSNLQVLDLSFNRFYQLAPKIYKQLPKLKSLNILNNPLDKKNEDNVRTLNRLKQIVRVIAFIHMAKVQNVKQKQN